MAKLKKELEIIYKDDVNVLAPKNCQTVKFNFVTYKTSKTIGSKINSFPVFKHVSYSFLTFVERRSDRSE